MKKALKKMNRTQLIFALRPFVPAHKYQEVIEWSTEELRELLAIHTKA